MHAVMYPYQLRSAHDSKFSKVVLYGAVGLLTFLISVGVKVADLGLALAEKFLRD